MNTRAVLYDSRTLERSLQRAESSLRRAEEALATLRDDLARVRCLLGTAGCKQPGGPPSPLERAILRWETEGGALQDGGQTGDRW